MNIYEVITVHVMGELRQVIYANFIWAYKNELSWFICVGKGTECYFVPVNYLLCIDHIGEPKRSFTRAILWAQRNVELSGGKFVLYQFSNFEEFAEYMLQHKPDKENI